METRTALGMREHKENLFSFILRMASLGGHILVIAFTRKNFGARGFTAADNALLLLFLFFYPVTLEPILGWVVSGPVAAVYKGATSPPRPHDPFEELMKRTPEYRDAQRRAEELAAEAEQIRRVSNAITWYGFFALLLIACVRHQRAKKRDPDIINFRRYSYSTGEVHPFLARLLNGGAIKNLRKFECVVEPAPFLFAGIFLIAFGQGIGWILFLSAIGHSLTVHIEYAAGDNYVLDIIDQKMISENLTNMFLADGSGTSPSGYRFLGRQPDDPGMRSAVMGRMQDDLGKTSVAK